MEVAVLRLQNIQHAAILRVPGEILVSIFRQFIKTSPSYEDALMLITSICYHLRALVFGTPELWGFVSMRGAHGPLFLERCQWNPISVVPFFYEADPKGTAKLYACLNYWRSMPIFHLTRVELIEFCGTGENFAAVSWIFNYHMPNLETLTVASGTLTVGTILSVEEDLEVWSINPSTRRTLKDVHLQRIFIPWVSNVFYGLSTLHLDYRGFDPDVVLLPMEAFLEVLSHSPYLEKCSLYFAIPECHSNGLLQDARPTQIINLPLKELTLYDETLNIAYLLRHLCLPSTTKTLLKVNAPPDELEGLLSTLFPPGSSASLDSPSRIALEYEHLNEANPALVVGNTTIQYLDEWGPALEPNDIIHTTFTLPLLEAVNRAGPSVRILKIYSGCELAMQPSVWKAVLENLPNLETLAFMAWETVDCQWPAFWNLLGQVGENGLICPNLQSLRIVSRQGIPPGSLTCLAARWKLERPLEVFHLRVFCERSLAQHAVEYLRPFVGQLIFEVVENTQIVSIALS